LAHRVVLLLKHTLVASCAAYVTGFRCHVLLAFAFMSSCAAYVSRFRYHVFQAFIFTICSFSSCKHRVRRFTFFTTTVGQ